MADKGNTQSQVKEIIKQLEDGMQELFTTEKYAEYLRVMSRFSKYSPRNVQLIHMQMPDATMVAGYQSWQSKFGRYVKRGEKGIRILAPTPFTITKEKQKIDPSTKQPIIGTDGLPVTEMVEEKIPRFRVIPVFDVSQTDGKPLPELAEELPGDVRHYELFMEALKAVSPLPLVIEPMEGKDGYCQYGEKVAVKEGLGEMQTVCATVHEIGHAKLHDPTKMADKDKEALEKKSSRTKEVEAESVSYVVCQYYGIDTAPNSFGYIAQWSKDTELKELNASLNTIRKTSAELIEAIDTKFRELAKERGIDLTEGRELAEAPAPAVEQAPAPIVEQTPSPEYDEGTAQVALERLNPGDLVYMEGADSPLHLVTIREADLLFTVPGIGVEIPQPHEQVLKALCDNPKNRHLLELAVAELTPQEPAREEPQLAPGQHIETIDGVDFVITTAGGRQPEQDEPLSEDREPEQYASTDPIKEADAFLDEIGGVGNLFGETTAPPVSAQPMEPMPVTTGEIMPDPAIGLSERDLYGYTAPDMLPATKERALELFEQDLAVYMLSPDNTEAMAFERDEIVAHDGIFGVEADEWRGCAQYRSMAAAQSETTKEAALLDGDDDAYGIYQLKDGDELHYHRFASLDQLNAEGNTVDRANYTLAYTAPLEQSETLEGLFSLHNQNDRPASHEMRSMSVSDVVVLRQGGDITSHYVDNNSFVELPSFLGVERQQPEQQTYSQPGNIPERPDIPDGPSVAELEAQVNAGQTISLLDLAHAVNRERDTASNRAKPSILAQLHDSKKTAAQGEDSAKTAPKRDGEREV